MSRNLVAEQQTGTAARSHLASMTFTCKDTQYSKPSTSTQSNTNRALPHLQGHLL